MRKLIALALVAAAAPMFAGDGNSATAEATATVTIFAPVTLSKDAVPFNLGKLVITDMSQTASISFANGAVGAKVNCADFTGSARVAATFPTFTLGKDAALGVSFAITSSNTNLAINPLADLTDSSTTSTFKLSGTWTFPANSTTGVQNSTISVTASYI